MSIIGLGAVVVGNDDQIAVGALVAGIGDRTAVGGADGGAVGAGDIQAGVVAVAAEDVPSAEVGGDPAADGPLVAAGGSGLGLLLGATAFTVVVASRRTVVEFTTRLVSWPLT